MKDEYIEFWAKNNFQQLLKKVKFPDKFKSNLKKTYFWRQVKDRMVIG